MPTAVRHLLSVVASLVVTPVAVVLLALGASRDFRSLATLQADGLRVPLLLGGVVLLLVVTALGALAWSGPLLAGVVFGLLPLVVYWASPRTVFRLAQDLPGVELGQAATYFANQTPLGLLGAALVGAAIAGGLGRLMGRRSAAAARPAEHGGPWT